MLANLALSSCMVAATVLIHFVGLLALLRALQGGGARFRPHDSMFGQALLILFVVFGIFAIHTIEIWLYATVYVLIGASTTFEEALYFSTVTFASLGYGDVVLSERWRLFGAIEAANGVILFAWSTAFMLSVMGKLKTLEHNWLEERPKRPTEP